MEFLLQYASHSLQNANTLDKLQKQLVQISLGDDRS